MKTKLEIGKDGLTLDSKPFYLASGDMHYFRYLRGGWRRRLQLMKDFGLTAIQTYVPWNLHEPEEGVFCFEDNLNVSVFLELCEEIGLKVMLRPSVYMCAEWDFGGLPYWLLNKKDAVIRTSAPEFMKCVRRYYERLAKEFVPYLSTNGGPIIAVAVENEYGSFSDDLEYMAQLGDLLVELGVDVPLFTANGASMECLKNGSLPQYWTGIDLHKYTDDAKKMLFEYQPDKPAYIAELWTGRAQKWGGYFARQRPEDVAANYNDILKKGAYVNFYMFCGGTNFGFQNGASVGRYFWETSDVPSRYIPQSTSYDVDALVTEYGEPSAKYFACKKVLKSHMESLGFAFGGTEEEYLEHPVKTQSIELIRLTESADLLDNRDNISHGECKAPMPCTFEAMGQAYGFMLYHTRFEYIDDDPRSLSIDGLHDRALIFADGKYLGCYMRDREVKAVAFTVPKEGIDIEILVENLGRINCAYSMMGEYKGICGLVRGRNLKEDGTFEAGGMDWKSGWTSYSLPLKSEDLSRLDYTLTAKENRPAIYKGSFEAEPGVDTFINTDGWKKGCIFINGFNIGRYWNVGPQGTLYVPGELLKEKNIIHILELHSPKPELTLRCDSRPSLDTIAISEARELVI